MRHVIALALATLLVPQARAVTPGQVDDFQDATTMGWHHGPPSPNPPQNVPTGGPGGALDAYLQVLAHGGGGAGGRLVVRNRTQWAGDYGAANVVRIDMSVANFGATPLHLRIGMQGSTFSIFSSTTSVTLPPDGTWTNVSFGLTAADMSLVAGTGTLAQVLAGVVEMRILSAAGGPAWPGDEVQADLRIDDITAVSQPVSVDDGSWTRVKARWR